MNEEEKREAKATVEPESFSPDSARLALEELFEAIPKARRLDHIGALNEVGVVLGKLAAGLDSKKAL